EADKPAWTTALNTSFASESAKLKSLMPVLNTASRIEPLNLGGRRDANVTDAAQQKALSARYEAIQQEAAAIKQSQGADVAQAYAAAAQQA
ncbi:hypothetical protein ABK046_46830, partial [Streptomyces caeruleatus]